MTTDTLTLSAFLLARIEDDEARAVYDANDFYHGEFAERLSAECASKRRIAIIAAASADATSEGASAHQFNRILRALAAVYADHPDYRSEWAA